MLCHCNLHLHRLVLILSSGASRPQEIGNLRRRLMFSHHYQEDKNGTDVALIVHIEHDLLSYARTHTQSEHGGEVVLLQCACGCIIVHD